MESIGVIIGLTTVGYLLDQFVNNKSNNENFSKINMKSYINSKVEDYPWNYVENFEEEISPLNPQSIKSPENITAISTAGNPPPEYAINANERPVDDFMTNNMVPFFSGTSTNQDMRGTGVQQGNFNSDDYNLGNDGFTPNNTTLGDFTGTDNTYFHKREAPNFFSPLERKDRNTIPGEDPSAQRP
jgi:hypothetical protein